MPRQCSVQNKKGKVYTMTFREASEALGIVKYPEVLDTIVEKTGGKLIDICDLEQLQKYEETYDLFGKYYDAVMEGAKAVKADPVRYFWGQVVATYIVDCRCEEAK